MTSIVSDSPISSSRSAEISSTASPLRRAVLMCSQIAAWAPTSTPRVGCDAISQDRIVAHLAPDDQLLLIAAGQRARQGVDARRADVVLPDDPLGVGARARAIDPRAAHGGLAGLEAEDPVLPERRVEQEGVPLPVGGDPSDACLAPLARIPLRHVLALQADRARGRGLNPHDRLDQLFLAVALDPGDS